MSQITGWECIQTAWFSAHLSACLVNMVDQKHTSANETVIQKLSTLCIVFFANIHLRNRDKLAEKVRFSNCLLCNASRKRYACRDVHSVKCDDLCL